MAVNEKVDYANQHTTFNGRVFQPGEQLTGRVPDYALASAREHGLTTQSGSDAERFKRAELDRRDQVAREIESRSEKREHNERRAGNIPQLVRMPDGSLREVTH